ncbi:MAG: CapA family protein [Clostridia bacterium]|nr:CapA family protein [Clostridia bacterium]
MKFTAVGDMIIQKRVFEEYLGFKELAPFIKEGDARFFNLETTLNYEGEASVSQFSGGTYLRCDPRILEDIKPFGFNMTSFNNNHALDYFYDGLESTLVEVQNSGLVHAGVGRNLAEASAPRYLETPNGRVALIAVNTTFDAPMMAGEQSPRVKGRPGINGIRVSRYVELPREELEYIKKLADEVGINNSKNIVRREGYYDYLPDDEAEFGDLVFKLGEKKAYKMKANAEDIARVEKAIYEAQLQADYIIISIHSHQVDGDAKEQPAKFYEELCRHFIDKGANAVVGHGPHLLRPVEIYKGRPIFYSLGDFIVQLYNVEFAPEDFFRKHGLDSSYTVHDLLKKRSRGFTVGLMEDSRMFRSVIPQWETDENGNLTSLKFMPVEMSMKGNKSESGLPRRSYNPEIFEYFKNMCEPYGTHLELDEDGIIHCIL